MCVFPYYNKNVAQDSLFWYSLLNHTGQENMLSDSRVILAVSPTFCSCIVCFCILFG